MVSLQGWGRRERRLFAALISIAALLVALWFFATSSYRWMYETQWPYDDSGYWLIALKSFAQHGGLYSTTYSQAGPFYYEFWYLVFRITGSGIIPDNAYLMSLLTWLTGTVLVAGSVWILTRRLVLTLVIAFAAWVLFDTEVSETMEPAHLAYVLVALVLVLVSALPRFSRGQRRAAFAAIGALCCAAVFTKVNVGVLLSVATCATVALHWPASRLRRIAAPLAWALLVVLPLVLMEGMLTSHGHAGHEFRKLFVLLECTVIGAASVALSRSGDTGAFEIRDIVTGVAAAAVLTVAIALGMLADGTSLSRLVNGAFLSQRNLANLYSNPLALRPYELWAAAACCLIAILLAFLIRFGRTTWLRRSLFSPAAGVVRILAGTWMLVTAVHPSSFSGAAVDLPGGSFILAAPCAWIALIGQTEQSADSHRFARTFIVLLGVVGCLEVYPVAGSQLVWAAVMLMPCAALCLWDGWSILGRRLSPYAVVRHLPRFAGALAGTAIVWGAVVPLHHNIDHAWNASVPLKLPGAQRIRQPLATAIPIRRTADYLHSHCSTFISEPGVNTFYFLAQEQAPTGFNTTQWRKLLSRQQQAEVIKAIRPIKRLCVLYSAYAEQDWYPAGTHVAPSRLYSYITGPGFKTSATFGQYSIATRART